MGTVRNVTVASFLARVDYELRQTSANRKQYSLSELVSYLQKCCELIYHILVEANSEIVATGSGSLVTVVGTETYDLAANTMGDLWLPFRITDGAYEGRYAIYLTDSGGTIHPPIEMVPEGDRFGHLVSGSTSRARPEGFYISGSNLGLIPVPDAVYTVTIPKYFPNYEPLPAHPGPGLNPRPTCPLKTYSTSRSKRGSS